jgi:hypothetical protein
VGQLKLCADSRCGPCQYPGRRTRSILVLTASTLLAPVVAMGQKPRVVLTTQTRLFVDDVVALGTEHLGTQRRGRRYNDRLTGIPDMPTSFRNQRRPYPAPWHSSARASPPPRGSDRRIPPADTAQSTVKLVPERDVAQAAAVDGGGRRRKAGSRPLIARCPPRCGRQIRDVRPPLRQGGCRVNPSVWAG